MSSANCCSLWDWIPTPPAIPDYSKTSWPVWLDISQKSEEIAVWHHRRSLGNLTRKTCLTALQSEIYLLIVGARCLDGRGVLSSNYWLGRDGRRLHLHARCYARHRESGVGDGNVRFNCAHVAGTEVVDRSWSSLKIFISCLLPFQESDMKWTQMPIPRWLVTGLRMDVFAQPIEPQPARAEKVLLRNTCLSDDANRSGKKVVANIWGTSIGSPIAWKRLRPSMQRAGPSFQITWCKNQSWKSGRGTVDSAPGTPVILQNTSTSSLTFPLTGASWTLLGVRQKRKKNLSLHI